MKSVSKQELVKLLSICGQVAEHKSGKMQSQWLEDHREHHHREN